LIPLQSSDTSVVRLVEASGERDGQPVERFTAVAVGQATLAASQGCGRPCGGGADGQVAEFLAPIVVEVTSSG